MNGKYMLKILGSLEELNTFCSYRNYTVFHIDPFNYGLLVYTVEESLISFCKLSIKEIYSEDNLELISSTDEGAFKTSLLNVFHLPFTLLKVICTSNNIWVIGQQSVLDLKPYVQSVLKKALEENDKCMDIDDEEFHREAFSTLINVHNLQIYDFHLEDIFIGVNSVKHGFIQCHKNSNLNVWQLELTLLNDGEAKSTGAMTLSFLEFPISFNETDVVTHSAQGQTDTSDPVILFINSSDQESYVCRDIFGINCPSSNILCLVGHPDGKLLWSLCDYNNQFQPSDKLQTLYDVKQPIIGIYFVDNIEMLEGCSSILVVGVLGQITVFSSKKIPSFTLVPGLHPFWIKTVHLKSAITVCTIIKDCLLHLSNGILWITDLSIVFNRKESIEESCLASNSTELCSVEDMIVVSKSQGLMLFITSSGNIYLSLCKKISDLDTVTSSLPTLMNECLQQSTVMQELLHKKFLQSRFFTAVSAFASLKFSDTFKETITFSISEVNLDPRKYILVINFKCFEKLHLDSELCHVTATVFTYFEKNFSLVTKTAPYIPDEPTLCLELTDTVLQPPFVSIFPLFVEVGLTLQLPDEWKLIDCFKSVANCLPFYLRVQTFMVHELHLFQSNVLCPPQSYRCKKPKAMKIIEDLAMKRPISSILQVESKKEYQLPIKFNLCLSASSVKEMIKDLGDVDLCEYIKNILLRNRHHSSSLSEGTIKQSPVSVEVTNKNNYLVISLTANSFDSLIGFRIAVLDILIATHNQSKCVTSSSTFVSIPTSIYKKCEDISKSLLNLYGKDVESDEVTDTIIQLYQELRRDVSAKLPIL